MTWDKALFPLPDVMQNDIASRGRKIVAIVDPHIKRDSAYPVFKDAEDAGHFVKNKDGKDFDGCVLGSIPYTLEIRKKIINDVPTRVVLLCCLICERAPRNSNCVNCTICEEGWTP